MVAVAGLHGDVESAALATTPPNRRWCWTSTMLPPALPMIAGDAGELARQVGRSSAAGATMRPSRTRPRISTEASRRVSMLPPHSTRPTLRPANSSRIGEQRGQAGGARALGHRLLDLEQQGDGVLDRRPRRPQHAVDQRRGRWRAAACRCRARRCPRRWCRRPPSPARRPAAGASPSSRPISTPITLMSGLRPARGDGAAGDHAAAADRHHQRVELRHVLQHLERDRALAGDDARIVVGMDEHQLVLGGQAMRLGAGLGQGVAVQHDASRRGRACASTLVLGVKDGMTMVAGMPSRPA